MNLGKPNIPNGAYSAWYMGDSTLLIITSLLIAIGLVMMTSASIEISENNFGDEFYYLKRQLQFLCIGIFAAIPVIFIPLKIWRKNSPVLFLAALAMLTIVLIPGVGKEVNGSMRWLDLGFTTMQASEPAKLMIIIFMAWLLSKYREFICTKWVGFLMALGLLIMPVLLLEKEPDLGAIVVLVTAVLGMMFLAGVKIYQLAVVVLLAVTSVVLYIRSTPFRLRRVEAYFDALVDPFNEDIVYGTGYQLSQALIAFGRGEWFGVGLGNSIQKLYFLPEAHTDFVVSIIAEELGAVGVLGLLGIFIVFFVRAIKIARNNEVRGDLFSAYLGYGIVLLFMGQIIINIGVNVGLIPNKGLTLPFISAGGSSLVVCIVMMAFLLKIDKENSLAIQNTVKKKNKGSRR